jgi:hypothetical protein
MASFADIRTVRLTIGDPAGVVEIAQAADPSALPSAPGQQTAYLVASTGRYMTTEIESGAIPADYHSLELLISDAQISQLIAEYGVTLAPCKAYGVMASRLGSKLRLVRTQSGAESTQYLALLDAYKYYKSLAADCADKVDADDLNTTGRWGRTRQPRIAGGET